MKKNTGLHLILIQPNEVPNEHMIIVRARPSITSSVRVRVLVKDNRPIGILIISGYSSACSIYSV